MECHHRLIKNKKKQVKGHSTAKTSSNAMRLTGGAVDAADAVGVVQVATVQLSVETEFGELPGLADSLQLAVYIVGPLQDGLVFMSFVVTLEV